MLAEPTAALPGAEASGGGGGGSGSSAQSGFATAGIALGAVAAAAAAVYAGVVAYGALARRRVRPHPTLPYSKLAPSGGSPQAGMSVVNFTLADAAARGALPAARCACTPYQGVLVYHSMVADHSALSLACADASVTSAWRRACCELNTSPRG